MTIRTRPDAAMMRPVRAVARFMATLDRTRLTGIFAARPLIVENFAPHIFQGPGAVARWERGFREHAASLSGLVVTFGEAQDFRSDGKTAYFVLPTAWTGKSSGQAFEEEGGWAFVLKRKGRNWRIACYAWAVTALRRV